MRYDPVKSRIGRVVSRNIWLRKIFYALLDILLLRTWHVKKALRRFARSRKEAAGSREESGSHRQEAGRSNEDVRVLDAGSGFGQYTWRMWKINNKWDILGTDIKQEQIDDCKHFISKTKAAPRVDFRYADLTTFREEEKYDLVLSVDVMEHIEDDRQVFRNFYDSLRPGGWLIISTPSDKGGSDVHDHDDHSFIDEHVRDGYGVEEIEEKLEEAGFGSIKTEYTYGRPGKISWRISMKYPVLMLNTSMAFAIILPLYYILVMPFALILNYLDIRTKNKEGSGLLVRAVKK
ncbi:MAG: class I SAM-dependent methyltransferase [Bacteroidales bacterium]|nr:class I SAM-dependent methyltransferase [Bacteroidales bacterium]